MSSIDLNTVNMYFWSLNYNAIILYLVLDQLVEIGIASLLLLVYVL